MGGDSSFAATVAGITFDVYDESHSRVGLVGRDVGVHGGGIAIGHPIGASGNRLVVHLAHELAKRGSGTVAVGLCGGGGQGEALILTR